jgi:RND family efflux transporter MFP subunit
MGEPDSGTRRAARIWAALVLLIVSGFAGIAVWKLMRVGRPGAQAQSSAHWILPQIREVRTQVNATGIVRLKTGAEVRVGAQVSGIVGRLFVTVGSRVTQGQVIAEIDSRPIEAKVRQARDQLAQALVAEAKANEDEQRGRQLFDAGVISKQQYDDAQAALAAAKAAVETAQSGVAEASVDLGYTQIRAPIQGTVATVSTQQGETVAASFATPTFVTIIQKEALEVVAMVDEADIGNVRPGEQATFTTETWPDHEFSGTVERVAPAATIISGVVNYEVAIAIRRDVRLLKPDMTSNVNIVTAERRALVVPAACLQRDNDGTYVLIRSNSGTPVRRGVTPGSKSGNKVEIVHGVEPGMSVLEPEEQRR